ncbi:hypothetical protein Bca52824_065159 [Brassica carinata]|uniref:Uncharacterized protein n=1 Tax=Brassica carinata TaxID=52824 RepID=A0A8X7QHS6_BRACI|nr:hypothetical protein Bca52824_065159 [Brassica carinata]
MYADVLSDIDAPAVETNPHLQDSADGRSDIDDPAVKNNPHLQDSADVLPDTNAPAVETNPHLQDSLIDPPPTSNENDAPAPLYRKSKRPRVVPRSLVCDYQCDKRILVRAWEAHVFATRRVPNIDYAVKFAKLSSKLESPM